MIDPVELRKAWDDHRDRLTLIARSMADPTDGQDAEDAVQEAFISLAAQSELPDDPLAWLVRVTRNQLLQWRRSHTRRKRRERQQDGPGQQPTDWFLHPQSAIDRELDGRVVTTALLDLPAEQRQVIVMHLWGELTFDGIAAIVDRSRSTVHRLYVRGLGQLKQRFDPQPAATASSTLQLLNDGSDTVPSQRR